MFTLIISTIVSILLLTGCSGEKKTKELPITKLIDLSSSNILKIHIMDGSIPKSPIENSDQIEEICSFLSSAFTLKNEYTELEDSPSELLGGYGAYFVIIYSDNTSSQIWIANGIHIRGKTKEGEIKDKWRTYPLIHFSQQERLNEILSMEPVS